MSADISVHSNTKPTCQAFELKTLPSIPFWPLARFIWAPFNTPEHTISYSKDDPSFNIHTVSNNGAPPLRSSMLTPNQHASIKSEINAGYSLHRANNNPNFLAGSAVIHLDGLCSAFDPSDNLNLFGHLFSIEFTFMPGQPPILKLLLAYIIQMSSPISYLSCPILFALTLQYQC
jgi:hypothetical protein